MGTAAIQLIVAAGATAIATVGSEEKIAATKGYGAVAAFNRHDGPWVGEHHYDVIEFGAVME